MAAGNQRRMAENALILVHSCRNDVVPIQTNKKLMKFFSRNSTEEFQAFCIEEAIVRTKPAFELGLEL